MKRRHGVLIGVAILLLGAGLWAAHRLSFDWGSLRTQLHSVSAGRVLLACVCIYAGFWIRCLRWRVLIGPDAKVSAAGLLGPQFIGFSTVGLFGRLADLTRPYLIAKRTGLTVSSQVAVYSIERIFDLAAAAILFSVTLAFAPRDIPHHEAFARAGLLAGAATVVLSAFAVLIRFTGERLAALIGTCLQRVSPSVAESVSRRILEFQKGLVTLRSVGELAAVLSLSLLLWLGIAECYVLSAHAFTATPQLATLTFTQVMLLMATSMGGSLVQLPVVGWFTQIALLATALHTFFGAGIEAATACAAVVLFTTTLCILPAGIAAARLSGTSLRGIARQSSAADVTA